MLLKAALVFAATLLYSSLVMGQDDCPCFYGVEDNEGFAVCADRSLTEIPECVPSDTTNLTISTPTIPLVPGTLQRFTNLIQLVISDFNDVVEISTNFLLYQKNLKYFDVRNTSLDYVDNRWFMYARGLWGIGMINNKIASVAENTYKDLTYVDYIRLEGNQLTTLPATIFEGVNNLRELTFGNNPWHCDCDLMKVLDYLKFHGGKFMDEPLCWQPMELRGMKLRDLTEELACEH